MDEIEFREVNGDRVAFLAGWDVPVWRAIAGAEARSGDFRGVARQLRIPVRVVISAVRYAAAHPDEIRRALREHRTGHKPCARAAPPLVLVADVLAARLASKNAGP